MATTKTTAPAAVKFNRYNITSGAAKAKVRYSLDNRADKQKAVTIYEQDFAGQLKVIFPANHKDDTGRGDDYFDQGRVVLFETHPLYKVARARAEENQKLDDARYAAKVAA